LYTGGKKQEMVVTVEDSNKGLNYVAAGVGRYNNKEVVGSPAILSGCTAQYRYRNPFSAGGLTAPVVKNVVSGFVFANLCRLERQ